MNIYIKKYDFNLKITLVDTISSVDYHNTSIKLNSTDLFTMKLVLFKNLLELILYRIGLDSEICLGTNQILYFIAANIDVINYVLNEFERWYYDNNYISDVED